MKTKRLVIIKGKGTPKEKRIKTKIMLYYSETLKTWVTLPGVDGNG